MQKSSLAPNSKRDSSIDILRGTAVILMIITHVNALLYRYDNDGVLGYLTWLGATLCFTTFLFCSAYVYRMKLSAGKSIELRKTLIRAVQTFTGYLAAGLVVIFFRDMKLNLEDIVRLVTLQDIPYYAEFILTFILLDLFVLLFQKPLRLLGNSPLTLLLGLLSFLLALALYDLEIGNTILLKVKELLIGHGTLHRFGLFTYMPIIALGFYLPGVRADLQLKRGLALFLLLIINSITIIFLTRLELQSWERWPPSPLFYMYGINFIFITLWLAPNLERFPKLIKGLTYYSVNTYSYYVIHIFIMFALQYVVLQLLQERLAQPGAILANLFVQLACYAVIKGFTMVKKPIF